MTQIYVYDIHGLKLTQSRKDAEILKMKERVDRCLWLFEFVLIGLAALREYLLQYKKVQRAFERIRNVCGD